MGFIGILKAAKPMEYVEWKIRKTISENWSLKFREKVEEGSQQRKSRNQRGIEEVRAKPYQDYNKIMLRRIKWMNISNAVKRSRKMRLE